MRRLISNQVYAGASIGKSTEAISQLNKPAELEKQVKIKFEETHRKSESGNPLKTIFKKRPSKNSDHQSHKIEFFEAETLD